VETDMKESPVLIARSVNASRDTAMIWKSRANSAPRLIHGDSFHCLTIDQGVKDCAVRSRKFTRSHPQC
jgi:hypothetical protein